jgi:hypothetical protein
MVFAFVRRNDFDFDNLKIIVNAKNKTSFSLSLKPCYSSGGGLGGQNFIFPDSKRDKAYYNKIDDYSCLNDFMFYVTALLNSNIISNNINEGKYNQLSTQKIEDLLLYKINFHEDKEQYDQIVSSAKKIMELLEANKDADISNELKIINSLIERLYC